MQRRSLLQLGAGAGAVLALAGLGAAMWSPGWRHGQLSDAARGIFTAAARCVLEGILPDDAHIRSQALAAHLVRVEASIAGLSPATRAELSDLLAVLTTAPGRLALTGLRVDWSNASTSALSEAFQGMRLSSSSTRRQIYQAFRDLTNAAWFADAGSWDVLGYPGPQAV